MSRSRRVKQVILRAFVPASLFVALLGWAFASPIGASPDEDYHLVSAWCGGGLRSGLCEAGDHADERRVPETLIGAACYNYRPEASAECVDDLSPRMTNTDRGNFVAGYPPVFYGTMSLFAGPDVGKSVLMMRAFNALLFVAVVSTLFFLLPPGRRGPLLWGGLVTIVPLGMFLIPSINPSSWAVISAMTLWVALLGFWTETSRRKKIAFGVLAGLMTIIAAGARADAATYSVLAVAVVAILTFERSPRFFRAAILPVALVLVAGLFFLAAGQSAVLNPGTGPSEGSSDGLLARTFSNLILLPHLWSGALGTWGLGWLDTALPASVWVVMIAAFAAVIFWGLQKLDRRKGLALVLVSASLVLVPLYILVKDHLYVGAGVQPRYIYPLMIMLTGIASLRFARDDMNLSRFQLMLIATLVVVANTAALHTNIRRYVTGTDLPGVNLNASVEWWWAMPLSPMGLWAIGSLAFAGAVGGIVVYLLGQKLPSAEAPPTAKAR